MSWNRQMMRYYIGQWNLMCARWFHVARARPADGVRCTILTRTKRDNQMCQYVRWRHSRVSLTRSRHKIWLNFDVARRQLWGHRKRFFILSFSVARWKYRKHAITFRSLLGHLQVLSAGALALKELMGLETRHASVTCIPYFSREWYSWQRLFGVSSEFAAVNEKQFAASNTRQSGEQTVYRGTWIVAAIFSSPRQSPLLPHWRPPIQLT